MGQDAGEASGYAGQPRKDVFSEVAWLAGLAAGAVFRLAGS